MWKASLYLEHEPLTPVDELAGRVQVTCVRAGFRHRVQQDLPEVVQTPFAKEVRPPGRRRVERVARMISFDRAISLR